MSTDRDVTTRIVRSWLHEDAHEDADRILNLVLDEINTTPQRSPSWLARRFPPMNNTRFRLGLAAAVVVLAVLIGFNYLSGRNVGSDPNASPSPSEAAPSPSAAAAQDLPTELGARLSPGTYSLSGFPVGITLEVGARWRACSESATEQGVCYWPTEAETAGQLAFLIITNAAADPCAPGGALLDPPVGPSVGDLVTAVSNLEGFVVTAPLDISIDGYSGKQITVTAPTDSGCEGFGIWATDFRTTGMGPGEINVIRIIDVKGVRVVIALANDPASAEAALFEEVLASVHIEP